MFAASPVVTSGQRVPLLAERAAAILRDEIGNGALANIASARQRWPAVRRDLVAAATSPRIADVSGLISDVLDLVVPSAAARSDGAPSAQRAVEDPPVFTAQRVVPPGETAVIRTGLQNDGPNVVEAGFLWSDLMAAPKGRIAAIHLRFSPSQVRLLPGASVDLTAVLDVPFGAPAGLYRVLVQATENVGLFAMLTFPVGVGAESDDFSPKPGDI
jgi:hypothetical protein